MLQLQEYVFGLDIHNNWSGITYDIKIHVWFENNLSVESDSTKLKVKIWLS